MLQAPPENMRGGYSNERGGGVDNFGNNGGFSNGGGNGGGSADSGGGYNNGPPPLDTFQQQQLDQPRPRGKRARASRAGSVGGGDSSLQMRPMPVNDGYVQDNGGAAFNTGGNLPPTNFGQDGSGDVAFMQNENNLVPNVIGGSDNVGRYAPNAGGFTGGGDNPAGGPLMQNPGGFNGGGNLGQEEFGGQGYPDGAGGHRRHRHRPQGDEVAVLNEPGEIVVGGRMHRRHRHHREMQMDPVGIQGYPTQQPLYIEPVPEPTMSPTDLSSLLGSDGLDLKTIEHPKEIKYEATQGGGSCVAKKRIVLDLKNTILGHRLLTLASTALLAVLMDRTLEIDWDVNPKICPYAYTDLFTPLKSDGSLKTDGTPSRPGMTYTAFDYAPRHFARTGSGLVNTCQVRLDQWNFDMFYLLKDRQLYDRMNWNCDIIYLKSNQFFSSLLLDENVFGEEAQDLKFQYAQPFSDFSKVVFVPRFGVNTAVNAFIGKRFAGMKWLSFYAKGFIEGSRDTTDAFACLNKLLDSNDIGAVFFTAENSRNIDLAYKLIKQKSKIVTIEKDMQNILTKDPRRKDMETILAQWMMIGKADYCMANSVRSTIFPMTGFVAGTCLYVPVVPLAENEDVSMCSINRTVAYKDSLFVENPRVKALPSEIDELKRNKVWSDVVQEQKVIQHQECFSVKHELEPVLNFWVESGYPKLNMTKYNATQAIKIAKAYREELERNWTIGNATLAAALEAATRPTAFPTITPKVDKFSIFNMQVDNWNPTPIPTQKPTPVPTNPYSFKTTSALDRIFGFKKKTVTPPVAPIVADAALNSTAVVTPA